jgi:hypothetical protein
LQSTPGEGLAFTTVSNLENGTYKVIVKLSNNNYYQAPSVESVIVVGKQVSESVTGGGWIKKNNQKVNFGFNAKKQNGSVKGELNMVDRSTGKPIQFKSTSLNSLVVNSDLRSAYFTGKVQINGRGNYTFRVDVADNDNSGSTDTFKITLSNGYTAYGTLAGGNIVIN